MAPAELGSFLGDRRRNAVVLGPGGGVGPAMREKVLAALASHAAVVLDADALTSFADHPDALADAIRKRRVECCPDSSRGEFSRLFKKIYEDHKSNSKLEKTRLAAEFCGAVVVYKGADTVVAAPDRRATIAENGPPSLATAGSGDVLAGIIGGLMAQGMPGVRGGQCGRLAAWGCGNRIRSGADCRGSARHAPARLSAAAGGARGRHCALTPKP